MRRACARWSGLAPVSRSTWHRHEKPVASFWGWPPSEKRARQLRSKILLDMESTHPCNLCRARPKEARRVASSGRRPCRRLCESRPRQPHHTYRARVERADTRRPHVRTFRLRGPPHPISNGTCVGIQEGSRAGGTAVSSAKAMPCRPPSLVARRLTHFLRKPQRRATLASSRATARHCAPPQISPDGVTTRQVDDPVGENFHGSGLEPHEVPDIVQGAIERVVACDDDPEMRWDRTHPQDDALREREGPSEPAIRRAKSKVPSSSKTFSRLYPVDPRFTRGKIRSMRSRFSTTDRFTWAWMRAGSSGCCRILSNAVAVILRAVKSLRSMSTRPSSSM